MTPIYQDLYQFTDFIPPIQLSLHQYLLLTEEPVLIHTGSISHTEKILPMLKEILEDRLLKYVLVSHYEADECGGLSLLQKEYPEVITVCSQIGARELTGFGYQGNIVIKKAGETLIGKDFEFHFVDYPSEVHLLDGLLFMEKNRRIFFSSDIMFQFGDAHNQTTSSSWKKEVEAIGPDRVDSLDRLEKMKEDLLKLEPKFVAVGHGYCINLL